MPNVKKIAEGIARIISDANVSTTTKKRITAAAERGLTPRQVAELVVRNEAKAAKALAAKGIKTKPKRYEYQGTGYSDRQLDAAFRASPEEGSAAAMARRMAAENTEKAKKKAVEKAEARAKVTMARNRAETVERTAKKRALTTSAPKGAKTKGSVSRKRQAELAEQRPSNPTDAAKVAARVRPPAGYSGAKKVKPRKRAASKPVDTSVKVTKPASKRTPQEKKDAKEAARKRRIAANARGRITGKDSVTKAPGKSRKTELKERPRTQAEMRRKREAQEEMRKKDYKNKGRAERQRDVDDQEVEQGYWIAGKEKGDPRVWISTADDAGIPARSTRGNQTIDSRSWKPSGEDLPPKDELTAIKKAFAELTKEEKAAMRIADERGIQGILREKILKGSNRKPAGPKDAPLRKRLTADERLAILKRSVRARRAADTARNKRIEELRKKLTPAQRKAVAKAIAEAKRNSR